MASRENLNADNLNDLKERLLTAIKEFDEYSSDTYLNNKFKLNEKLENVEQAFFSVKEASKTVYHTSLSEAKDRRQAIKSTKERIEKFISGCEHDCKIFETQLSNHVYNELLQNQMISLYAIIKLLIGKLKFNLVYKYTQSDTIYESLLGKITINCPDYRKIVECLSSNKYKFMSLGEYSDSIRNWIKLNNSKTLLHRRKYKSSQYHKSVHIDTIDLFSNENDSLPIIKKTGQKDVAALAYIDTIGLIYCINSLNFDIRILNEDLSGDVTIKEAALSNEFKADGQTYTQSLTGTQNTSLSELLSERLTDIYESCNICKNTDNKKCVYYDEPYLIVGYMSKPRIYELNKTTRFFKFDNEIQPEHACTDIKVVNKNIVCATTANLIFYSKVDPNKWVITRTISHQNSYISVIKGLKSVNLLEFNKQLSMIYFYNDSGTQVINIELPSILKYGYPFQNGTVQLIGSDLHVTTELAHGLFIFSAQ